MHAAGHPAARTPRASRTARRRKGRDTVALAFVGDGAHQRGRLPRGAQLRRRVQGAGRLLRPEQRVRDQRPALEADRGAVAGAQGRSATAWPAEQVDGNDPVAVLAVLNKAVAHARAGNGPGPGRGAHLPHATRTPTPTTPPATATRPRSPAGCARDPIARLEAYLRGAGPARRRRGRGGRGRGRGRRRRRCATRMNADAEVDPMSLFDHVYADAHPAAARAGGPCCGPSWRRRPTRRRRDAPKETADGRRDLTMAQALNRALRDAMAADHDVLVFGEDVGTARRRLPHHRRA